jgi:hypothetical protein
MGMLVFVANAQKFMMNMDLGHFLPSPMTFCSDFVSILLRFRIPSLAPLAHSLAHARIFVQ